MEFESKRYKVKEKNIKWVERPSFAKILDVLSEHCARLISVSEKQEVKFEQEHKGTELIYHNVNDSNV